MRGGGDDPHIPPPWASVSSGVPSGVSPRVPVPPLKAAGAERWGFKPEPNWGAGEGDPWQGPVVALGVGVV